MDLSAALHALEGLAAEGAPNGSIALELEGAMAVLTLDNPAAHNALSARMMVQLARAVQALAAREDLSMLLVRAAGSPGRAFCAGGDLRDVRASLTLPGRGETMALAMGTVLDALAALPLVSVAAVDGAALGGGAELLTAVDVRFAGPRARVGFVQASLGVSCGWGGTPRLCRIVGRPDAVRWLCRADSRAGDELQGFAERAPEGAERAARQFLEGVAANPVAAVRASKAQVVAEADGQEAQAALFARVWGGAAHRAALEQSGKGRG